MEYDIESILEMYEDYTPGPRPMAQGGRIPFSEGLDVDRYNKVRPIVNRDYNRGATDADTHKIVFKKSKNQTLPSEFEGTKFYPSEKKANEALKAKQKFIVESKEAKKKPPKPAKADKFLVKTGSPKKVNNVIEQEFIEVIGSKNVPSTYKKTGVKKTLYKPQIVVNDKTVLSTDFGSKADAMSAVKKYREKNPIKNAPPDLETLDERKKKRYLDKKERQADIKARGGVPEGGIFSGDPEVHKGHAGNIRGSQMITGDKIIYTPAKINQAMAGTEGENRFTDLDYKIDKAEKKINEIKKSNKSNVEKKKLLKIEDDKLIKYASQSDGYKVVKLSDGSEFRLPGKSLQSLDAFDAFPGMSEKDISKTINKYKNMKVTKNTSPKDIEMIKKVGVFLENVKLAKSNVPKNTGMMLSSNPFFDPSIMKKVISDLGKGINVGLGPTGILALNTALGTDPTQSLDRVGLGVEAAMAKPLVKGAVSVTDKIKNPMLRKIAERAALAGMSPAMAMKVARVASPIGIASLAGEGLYQVGKLGYEDQQRFNALSPEEQAAERAEQEKFAFNIEGS